VVGFFTNRQEKQARVADYLRYGRVCLQPLPKLDQRAWKRVQSHFRDTEISHLNGTPPNRMPLWFLKRLLKADSRRPDRATYGIYDERDEYIGTIELYDIRYDTATLGIIIGEKTHWGRGYGPEAMSALLTYAFNKLNLERVKLNTFSDNERAQAAFKKLGFMELRRVNAGSGRIDVQMDIHKGAWLERQVLRHT
jgi:RimJ/RimL family protein N-acetyltransferase